MMLVQDDRDHGGRVNETTTCRRQSATVNPSPQHDEPSSDRRQLILVAGCFLLSGFAALLYETVWLRQFSIHFGTSEQALATVLGTYMGGLALGSLIASKFAVTLRRPLLVYGLLELGIAVTALLVPLSLSAIRALQITLFGDAQSPPEAGELSQILFSFAGACAATILPTTMMGATLPMLAKHVVHRNDHLGNRIGALYAINTLGAVLGTLACAFILLPMLGLLPTTFVGAAVNVVVFAAVWWLLRAPKLVVATPVDTVIDEASTASPPAESTSNYWILWLIAASGAISFTYEVLFTRMLGHILGGTVFAFASMLSAFLLGIAIGGAVAAKWARSRWASSIGFFIAQCATAVLALGSWHMLEGLAGYINRLALVQSTESVPRVLMSIAILLLPAISIGMSFPWAIRIHARHARDAAKSSAKVYAWNTVGGVLGALITGTYLLPLTNYEWTMTIAVVANLMIAATVFWYARPSVRWALFTLLPLIGLTFARPERPDQLLRVSSFENYVRPGELEFVRTGRSATVTLHNYAGTYYFSTNGLPEAGAQPKGSMIPWDSPPHWMGVLPAILRPDAESMLVVGFGSGVTPTHAPRHVRDIDVFELEEGIIEANRHVALKRDRDPLADPRIDIILNDGRSGLALTKKTYDIIVSQPSHPFTAGASHLYTREFARLVTDHLTNDGVFLLWIDGQFLDRQIFQSLGATLASEFTHVALFRPNYATFLFICSRSEIELPVRIDTAEQDRRLFAQLGVDCPVNIASALALDHQGIVQCCEGAIPTTDNNNLLAFKRIDHQRLTQESEQLNALINKHDPWVRAKNQSWLSPTLDPVVLVQRRIMMGRTQSAIRIAEQIPDDSDRALAMGYLAYAQGKSDEADEWFQKSVTLRDGNQRAWIYRLLTAPAQADYDQIRDRLTEPYRSLAEAIRLRQNAQVPKIQTLDESLSQIPNTDMLYGPATLLRIQWRDAVMKTPVIARESLALIDQSTPYTPAENLYLFRIKAGMIAGRPHIVLSTAQALVDSIQRRFRDAQRTGTPMDANELTAIRLNLQNCLTAIDSIQNARGVPRDRFFGVRMVVQAQLQAIEAGAR